MGVNGLWTVVQPCARPTNLATLNRKRLAVDASIWIYQFLKAVRDKEGNALRNSHVVGFFRRICKLLWFGIQPVFVFDGGAPALKRATLQKRVRRREGRREDATRTAGKLLAVQMQRHAEEEDERRKQGRGDVALREQAALQESIPDVSELTYVSEIGMSEKEKQQTRKFHKQDAYHLPELDGGIASMGRPEDPRIMSVEELEEYARQFHNGEDVNLYDFSKIDFNGDFFKSLPPPDRYNILNAARLRSRLRMGLSKDQLDDMFPDRMAFSRFQIERVKERNHLTQRLMSEVGMTGTDLTLGINARVAGDKDREYILVKNEGAEGGWALGVVSKEKDVGEAHKPIDVDAIQVSYMSKDAEDESDEDFEDVPIEGINRLPKPNPLAGSSLQAAQSISIQRQHIYDAMKNQGSDRVEGTEESLFVGGNNGEAKDVLQMAAEETVHPEKEDDLNRAIALSLKNQHGSPAKSEDEDLEDVPLEPKWAQRAVEAQRPIKGGGSGSMIAHIVNNRASAAVPKRQEKQPANAAEGDSDDDMQTVMARAKKTKKAQPKPILENKKNPFDGPLPFPKLDWGSSLFKKKEATNSKTDTGLEPQPVADDDDEEGGGFEITRPDADEPQPLPPWLQDSVDIRESLKKQQDHEREINAEDKAEAEEENRLRQREMRDRLIEIDSSSDDGSDVEIIEKPPSPRKLNVVPIVESSPEEIKNNRKQASQSEAQKSELVDVPPKAVDGVNEPKGTESPKSEVAEVSLEEAGHTSASIPNESSTAESPEPEFEDVPSAKPALDARKFPDVPATIETVQPLLSRDGQLSMQSAGQEDDDLFADVEYDEFSDAEDEQLMAQMAEEAEEHARFASELNQKSLRQNQEDYEKELRTLRSQQKKDRRDADEVSQTMVTECQALLRLFGIPYITAPMEAEAQCAELVRLGIADGIVTDDSDTFLFGGTRVYKNMFNSNKFVECYLGKDLEKELSLSRDQLISLAQLLGSDYTEGLSGVGPVTAIEILSEFPGASGLENFREWWDQVQKHGRSKDADASSPFRKKFRKSQATKLFLPPGFPNDAVFDAYLNPQVDNSPEPFQWGVPDLEGLRQFLMATIGWSKERTDEVLVPVIKDMNRRDLEGTQSNITRFFSGRVGAGASEGFAPREKVQSGSKRMAAAVDKLRSKTTAAAEDGGPSKRRRTAARAIAVDDEDE